MILVRRTDLEGSERQIQRNISERVTSVPTEDCRLRLTIRTRQSSDYSSIVDDSERVLKLDNVERETEGQAERCRDC